MPRTAIILAAALALYPAANGWAQPPEAPPAAPGLGSSWLLNGAGVGPGRNALHGEFGWPGLALTFLHGQSSNLDLGGYFAFTYGFEGIPDWGTEPGLKLGGVLRMQFLQRPDVNAGLRFSPGLLTSFPRRVDARVGLTLPVELVVGIPLDPRFGVHVCLALPFGLIFTGPGSLVVMFPIEPGFGFEYRLDHALSFTFDSRMGPSIVIDSYSSRAKFAFRALLGIGYRF